MTKYSTELTNLWQQLDFFRPIVTDYPAANAYFARVLDQDRAYKFLDGINSEFDQVRQQLTQKEPGPLQN